MFTFKGNCWLCHLPVVTSSRGICSLCLRQLPPLPPLCHRCGLPAAPDTRECGRCLIDPPPWQTLVCASDYQPPLSRLLHQFKFSGNTALAVMLAKLILLSWLQRHGEHGLQKPDLIVSSPCTGTDCGREASISLPCWPNLWRTGLAVTMHRKR